MTGCPNGCARPYTPDIGLVGKTLGKYTILWAETPTGTRLAFIYKDLVPFDDIVPSLAPLLARFKSRAAKRRIVRRFLPSPGQRSGPVATRERAAVQANA